MDHKKYHLIQGKIEEARNALRLWNDRRAEVMIELDSMFMEIEEYKKQLSDEKSVNERTIVELKAALEKSETDYHKHFEVYTNDMQELKIANDSLSVQLRESNSVNESLRREMKKMESDFQAKLAKIASDSELRMTELQVQTKTQVATLADELRASHNEKNNLLNKTKQYEKELRLIRNQMMNFLSVTQGVTVAGGDAALSNKSEENDEDTLLMVDGLSDPPSTVNEYLKRFGY